MAADNAMMLGVIHHSLTKGGSDVEVVRRSSDSTVFPASNLYTK